jgi:hypothetical protein
MVTLTLLSGGTVAEEPPKAATAEVKEVPIFAEADAARVMDAVRQALESGNRSRFLKLFDARRMPGYAAFRDQVAEFFDRYVGFQVQYHLTQITMDRDLGGLMADVVIDALPADKVTPNVRRNAQLRLVLAWDGRWWKIVDWSPRGLLR